MNRFEQDTAIFLQKLSSSEHLFADTLSFIKKWFDVTATAFINGNIHNSADSNQGSCQVLALAEILKLTHEQTLECFGEHFRHVQSAPNETSHLNLREIMKHPKRKVEFDHFPLHRKDMN